MPDIGHDEIAERIRAKIRVGALPVDRPEKVYVGRGTGHPCSGCEWPLLDTELEYEFDAAGDRIVRFHQPCLAAWHAERAKPAAR